MKKSPVLSSNASSAHKWVLYGLAANPPHTGHWSCVRYLQDQGYGVLIAPSFSHAFGKVLAPFEMRLGWLRDAATEFGVSGPRVHIWDEERTVAAGKTAGVPVYSIEMLRRANAQLERSVALAIGPDNANPTVFSRFHQHEAITRDHGVVVLPETMSLRSSQIRAKLSDGGGVDDELMRWVGRSIAPSVVDFFAPAPENKTNAGYFKHC